MPLFQCDAFEWGGDTPKSALGGSLCQLGACKCLILSQLTTARRPRPFLCLTTQAPHFDHLNGVIWWLSRDLTNSAPLRVIQESFVAALRGVGIPKLSNPL